MARLNAEDSSAKILQAEKSLGNKRDVKLVNRKIFILNGEDAKNPLSNDMGIASWGKVDALVNFGGYKKYSVNNFKDLHIAR